MQLRKYAMTSDSRGYENRDIYKTTNIIPKYHPPFFKLMKQ